MKALDPIRVEYLGKRRWKVLEDICYGEPSIFPAPPSRIIYTVPANFVTDFISIPRGLWNLLPPTGEALPAAVLHDWMYVNAVETREFAAWIFLESMEELGVPYWKRRLMWVGVRIGGKGNYG